MLSQGNLDILQKPKELSKEDKAREALDRGATVFERPKGKEEGGELQVEEKKTVEELKQLLDKARDDLARKKGELKDFEMLFVGTLKGLVHGEKKANIQKEYDEFLKKYQEARAKYVVADVSKLTEERMKLAEALVEAKGKGEEHFLYKGYKWLGDQNVAKLFSEGFKWKLSDEFQKDHPLATGTLRIAGKFLSVRTALSLGLLGAGLMAGTGSGLALGLGILGARAAMRGIGTAAGSHDMLKLIGAEAWESKGTLKYKKENPWYKKVSLWEKLTPEEMGKMGKEKIEERLANMEANALLHGKKVSESEVYKQLLSEYENKLKTETHEKGESVVAFIKDLSDASDKKRDNLAREKRIKHQTIVGVLTAAMVILPGIHQFQRVIDKNAAEWAAVTKKTGEAVMEPAHAATREAVVSRDIHVVADLKDKAVKFALEINNHAQPNHRLSIEDFRHIRNIASRATQDGVDAKKLLQYMEKRNLIEQAGIHTVPLEGNHTTVYGALEEAAKKHPELAISVKDRGMELAKQYGVTVDQLKTLPHTGEKLYFSKEGIIITQEKTLVGQAGNVSHAHEITAGTRSHVSNVETSGRHIHKEIHHPRSAEDLRGAQQDAQERSHETPRVVQSAVVDEINSRAVKPPETVGQGKVILEIEEAPVEKPPAPASEAASQPKLEVQEGVLTETAHISPEEVFAKGYDQAHITEFIAAARENPDEFLKYFKATAQYDLYRYEPRFTLQDIRLAITDPKMGETNIKTIMGIVRDHTKPFKLTIGNVDKNFSLAREVNDLTTHEVPGSKVVVEIEEAPAEKPSVPVSEAAPQPKLEIHAEQVGGTREGAPAVEAAHEVLKDGKFPMNMENFYGGKFLGSIKFSYDAAGDPIGYKTSGQMFGVGSSHDLENKFLFSGWGYDKSTKISEILWEKKSHVDTNLLRDMLHQYNRQLAFDIRLHDELVAGGHKAEAGIVLKGAKQILARVHEYGLDDQLINKANLPPELR